MRRVTFSVLGILLIIAAIAGILISIVGIIGLWRIERSAKASLVNTLDLLGTTVQATHDGLSIASRSLDQADDSLTAVTDMLEATGRSVEDMMPFMDSLKKMTVVDLPGALSSTKTAFRSAQASAGVIDNTLSLLTAIPFLSTPTYNNQPPLSTAFGGVSDSLDPISESLTSMEGSLSSTKDNLGEIEGSITSISDSLSGIQTSLSDAKGVTDQYLTVLEDLGEQVDNSKKKLPAALQSISWFITIALVWLALTQLGLLMQGAEMLGLNFVKELRQPVKQEAVVVKAVETAVAEEDTVAQVVDAAVEQEKEETT